MNADGLSYLGADGALKGYNLFVYCGNNPVIFKDSNGSFAILSIVGAVIIAEISAIKSYYRKKNVKNAEEKYSSNNVIIGYDDWVDNSDAVNLTVYGNDSFKNVNIDQSLEITNRYEQEAILKVFMNSDYYSKETFGGLNFMRAQWVAHNLGYKIASSGEIGFWMVKQISGSPNPIESANVLDIRSKNNIARTQKIVYTLFSLFM